jgi:hypothetical protein
MELSPLARHAQPPLILATTSNSPHHITSCSWSQHIGKAKTDGTIYSANAMLKHRRCYATRSPFGMNKPKMDLIVPRSPMTPPLPARTPKVQYQFMMTIHNHSLETMLLQNREIASLLSTPNNPLTPTQSWSYHNPLLFRSLLLLSTSS